MCVLEPWWFRACMPVLLVCLTVTELVHMLLAGRVLVAAGGTVDINNGDQLNKLSASGVGVVEGRIAVVTASISAVTVPPDEQCVMDVEVWAEVRPAAPSR